MFCEKATSVLQAVTWLGREFQRMLVAGMKDTRRAEDEHIGMDDVFVETNWCDLYAR